MQVLIEKLDHSGNGIGYHNGKIIFIPKAIPGDILDIEITNSYKKYDIGKIKKIIKSSDKLIAPKCPYYYTCGGCNISNLSYQEQLKFKEDKIINIFKKYLDKDIAPRVLGSKKDFEYRNKITYQVSNGLIGLVDIDNNFLKIDKCLLVSPKVNELVLLLQKEDLSKVSKIVIRECNNGLILSITGNMKIENLKKLCIEIYLNNEKKYSKEEGYLCIGNLKYRVSDKSFFQINTSNIATLYNEIIKYGEFTGKEKVIDLYCGVGSISLYVSKYVKSILGIEIVKEAIDDANYNKELNKIDNATFICSDVSKVIDDKLECDTLIVDPPRAGLDKHTKSVINNSNIKKIIYVSCDPMTLVRDLKDLDMYNLEKISIVDMFPQTCHVECASVLHRKKLEK